ncbi:GNAT family N-acetyltransferase [Pseudoalteromonas viridis]|uniref:GNAT family N-acetyltransferase n=1 Tax=Pseudoalteromonas viridis TaxID=339617 RepID=A0ABX7V011_9GAMM|nr:GNAT family protein [Pseudoalteromonas viridis]QTL34221.1 GNAT family N-acetyltransferase [Pseudoalteromonas viridis]
MKIDTQRFSLLELQVRDASARYLSWLGSSSGQYITNKASKITELKEYIASCRANPAVYLFGIFVKETGLHIGNIKFEFLTNDKSLVEMGILIGESEYQGKGVAAEVIRAFGLYARKQFGTQLMVLGVSRNNSKAISAYERIGFSPEPRALSSIDSEDGILMSWRLDDEL